jgi:thiosulfate reductase cytochrome b subunit
MTAGQQRKAQRRVHLAAALLLVAYLYAPLETQLQDAVRFLVLPALVVTGIAMWQAPRIRRLRKRLGATRLALSPTAPPVERAPNR